ncbi:similar to Saccharomyces cerevisiae YER142C MAG1 3-methyl-adenine DNA glycosylase involved in protecting DNA against alkylating agents [Maudiozyma saulgeensis]|uniref:Similar to Saccharomyces cerevisiae YER142C MAG1 3-methyl-adenine DNA glycosylase involved in protecting DNA against alkylating agents n=1 Tax=Maudiozyma saulgeensis TaxID=1789683 RepID=A0A1X7R7P6_9SACH|nr:similar to Saccharomyces cerevisiae YER142C MAG1 3-methyl-adenine DNA glycosylase involved in protecting DNA against alkylating agents [Kazachstania saulgeensis]
MKRAIEDVCDESQGVIAGDNKMIKIEDIPEDYRDRHVPAFSDAMDFILKKDNSLVHVFLKADFELFKKFDKGYGEPTDDAKLQNAFSKLGGAIVGQQISNSAARSIRIKFMALFDGMFPMYKELKEYMTIPDNVKKMRESGLSQRKVTYMESLAIYFSDNEERLKKMYYHTNDRKDNNDDEIMNDLVAGVKGIGPWTAKMFLVSGLRRINVFAPEDVGVARGFSRYISDKPELLKELMDGRESVKKSKIKHKKFNWKVYDVDIMERCADRFAPYRTVFMFLLWRLSGTGKLDVTIDVENQFVNTL